MDKKKKPRRPQRPDMRKTELAIAEEAIRKIALREGSTPEMVRKHIQVAIMSSLLSNDPGARAAMERIPKAADIPTPEEVIAYYAKRVRE